MDDMSYRPKSKKRRKAVSSIYLGIIYVRRIMKGGKNENNARMIKRKRC